MQLTDHSIKRAQQRGISLNLLSKVIELPSRYYSRKYAPGNAKKLIFTKKTLNKALNDQVIDPKEFDKLKGVCLVSSKNVLVTIYHI